MLDFAVKKGITAIEGKTGLMNNLSLKESNIIKKFRT